MSRSIASYPREQRPAVIRRRLAAKTNGAGYWAAVDAAGKLGISATTKSSKPKEA